MKLWPAIDLLDGRCVRLTEGDYAQCKVYEKDPLAMAKKLEDAGARRLHIVDLSRAKNTSHSQLELIAGIRRQTELKIQVGGGVRSLADAVELKEAGVDRLILGSLAVKDPAATREIMELPIECVLAIDVREKQGRFFVTTSAWAETSEMTAEQVVGRYPKASSILCTDISRDGKLMGPNFQLYQSLRRSFSRLEVIASGGVHSLEDLKKLEAIECDGVIVGKALYEGKFTLEEALACLQDG